MKLCKKMAEKMIELQTKNIKHLKYHINTKYTMCTMN